MIDFNSPDVKNALEARKRSIVSEYKNEVSIYLKGSLQRELNFVETLLKKLEQGKSLQEHAAKLQLQWVAIQKFTQYQRNYHHRVFRPVQLAKLRSKFSELHIQVQFCALFEKAKAMGFREKLRRKDPDNQLGSILKTEKGYFLITDMLLTQPTQRSVIKIIIPILEQNNGQLMLRFSQPMALKINHKDLNNSTLEALQFVYGKSAELFIRPKTNVTAVYPKSYIVFPIFPGCSISTLCNKYIDLTLSKYGFKNFNLFIKMMLAAMQELQRFHLAGWIHGDIKLENILCWQDGGQIITKIIDTDEMIKVGSSPRQSLPPSCIGTEYYRAPELRKPDGRIQLSVESDVYAMGLSFVKMLMPSVDITENCLHRAYWKEMPSQAKCSIHLQEWEDQFKNNLPENADCPFLKPFQTLITEMVHEQPEERPRIADIIQKLKEFEAMSAANRYFNGTIVMPRVRGSKLNKISSANMVKQDDLIIDPNPINRLPIYPAAAAEVGEVRTSVVNPNEFDQTGALVSNPKEKQNLCCIIS